MDLLNRKGQVLLADDTAPDFTALLGAAIAQQINLDDADFSNQLIEGLTFQNMTLSRLRLDKTQLKNVKFCNVKFDSCIVIKANFIKTDFQACKLEDCKFYQNQFSFCEFERSHLNQTHIYDTGFRDFLFDKCIFKEARFTNNLLECYAGLSGDYPNQFGFRDVKFLDSKIAGNNFKNTTISTCRFKNSSFRSNKIESSQILNSEFTDTDISRTTINESTFSKTSFIFDEIMDLRISSSVLNSCKFNFKAMINWVSLNTTYTTCFFSPYVQGDTYLSIEHSILEKNTFADCDFLLVTFSHCSLDYSDFRQSDLDDCSLKYCTLYDTKLDMEQRIKLKNCHVVEARAALGPIQQGGASGNAIVLSSNEEDDEMDED